jgi:hypothetical protein
MKAKTLQSVLLGVGFLGLCSCGEKLFTADVNCSECYTPKPDSAYMEVSVTINDSFPAVPLVFYRGPYEDKDIEYIDTAYSSPYYLWVKVDRSYSVKAKYRKSDATLYTVDGTKIKLALVTDACDQECYVIEHEKVNLTIRKKFSDFGDH